MTEQSLANRQETGMSRIKNYMLSPEVKQRFTDMMGPSAIYYLNQVLILVANSSELQKCDPQSILISAMRAASLRLSVDPSSGQAWIIPYNGIATFQLGYKGVYELAQRTKFYRFINVIPIYEGEELIENRLTGMHSISGHRASDKVIARMLYFQLINGFEKTFVMTVDEIEKHAQHYSKAYRSPKSKWNDPYERPKMEDKTVMINGLRKWGRFNQSDAAIIDQIEADGNLMMIPDESEVTTLAPRKRSNDQIMSELGFGPEPQSHIVADPETGEIIEEQSTQAPEAVTEQSMTEAAESLGAVVHPLMELATAENVKNSEGVRYGDLDNAKLSYMTNSISKALKKEGKTIAEKEEYQLKLDAIATILAARNGGEQ